MGPVHFAVLGFGQPNFHGDLVKELAALVERDVIRVLDVVFVGKDGDGAVTAMEIDDLPEGSEAYGDLDGHYGGLLADEDLAMAAGQMEAGTAGVLLVWENVWADRLVAAMAEAGGTVIDQGVIPMETVRPALASLE